MWLSHVADSLLVHWIDTDLLHLMWAANHLEPSVPSTCWYIRSIPISILCVTMFSSRDKVEIHKQAGKYRPPGLKYPSRRYSRCNVTSPFLYHAAQQLPVWLLQDLLLRRLPRISHKSRHDSTSFREIVQNNERSEKFVAARTTLRLNRTVTNAFTKEVLRFLPLTSLLAVD